MSCDWEWIPNRSLGPVSIGSRIESYIEIFALVKEESADATRWDTYIFPSFNTYIDTEDGEVVSITAYKEFFYKGQNLIGASIVKLGNLLGVKPDEIGQPVEYDDGDIKTPYEYFDLGLQIWVSNSCVTSASCMSYENE